MPSSQHEAFVQVVETQPAVVAELIRDVLGIEAPAYRHARVESSNATDFTHVERQADATVVLSGASTDIPELGVVVEAQLSEDKGKWWSWPHYLINLRTRLKIPVMLLVFTADPHTAAWCAEPIELGPGWKLRPFVVGPDQMPKITDLARSGAAVELAVLSALAHAADPDVSDMIEALPAILATTDPDNAIRYAEIVATVLRGSALNVWEAIMGTKTFEFQSRYARRLRAEGEAKGRAEGEARLLLRMLAGRSIDVPDDIRTRIIECTDVDQIEAWADRALTATSIHDLFD
jgi:hypothetical protein